MRHRSRRDDAAELRSKLRELAQQRCRFGYRRLHILLQRERVVINRKKTLRLYREEKLAVWRRRNRRRAISAWAPAPVLALPNQRWSLDFVHDQMVSGRRSRVLSIVDDVLRECLRAVPDTSIGYNQEMPRSALGYQTPAAFAAELDKQWPASLYPTDSTAQTVAQPALSRNKAAGLCPCWWKPGGHVIRNESSTPVGDASECSLGWFLLYRPKAVGVADAQGCCGRYGRG